MKKPKLLNRLFASNNGSVLVMAVVFSIATILLGTAYLRFVEHYGLRVTWEIEESRSFNTAFHAGIEGKYNHPQGGQYESDFLIYADDPNLKYRYVVDPLEADSIYYGYTSTHEIYGYGYASNPVVGEDFVTLIKIGDSYSTLANYLYLTERENQSYRQNGVEFPPPPPSDSLLMFWGPDTLDGKVHSNDKIKFESGAGYWPVFYKTVSSCSTRFEPPSVTYDNTVHFMGEPPYKLAAPMIELPVQADSVRKYGLWLGHPDSVSELTLQPTGFLYRSRANDSSFAQSRNRTHFTFEQGDIRYIEPIPYPALGAIFINGECWITAAKDSLHYNAGVGMDSLILEGFIGQLTIGASGDIIIPQDIKYEDAYKDFEGWKVSPSSRNVLGLISEKHILIWRNCNDIIIVMGGLAAIGYQECYDSIAANLCPDGIRHPVDGLYGTISVDGINCYTQDNEKDQLEIYGCVIMRERGLIHTSVGSYERGFVSKRYRYDPRFQHYPPPHFFPLAEPGGSYIEALGSLY